MLTRLCEPMIVATRHQWGRYQHRLAVGHASLGRTNDVLHHARLAVNHLDPARSGPVKLASALAVLATSHQELGDLDNAEKVRRRSVEVLHRVSGDSSEWIAALVALGDLCRFLGKYDEAEDVLCRALDGSRPDQLIQGTPARALALNALGILYKDTGRYALAADAYAESLALITASNGAEHPNVASSLHNLAGLALAQGDPVRAAPLASRAVQLRERHVGEHHNLVGQDLAVLGVALLELNQVDEAEALFERALTIFRRRHPADQYEVAVNTSNLAACSMARGDPTTAEPLYCDALRIRSAILGPHHPEIARQLNNLATAIAEQGRPNEASLLRHRARAIEQDPRSASHPHAEVVLLGLDPTQSRFATEPVRDTGTT